MNIPKYHYKFSKNKTCNTENKKRIVSIDTEWAKNWKAEEKFIPFCACFHTVYIDTIIDVINLNNIEMTSELYFRGKNETSEEYVSNIDDILGTYINNSTLFVGHQISSDLHSLSNSSKKLLSNVNLLIENFRIRKEKIPFEELSIFDTRYDIKNRVVGDGGEKLRNVSLRYKVLAVQTELDKMSLTNMYNKYLLDSDSIKREMLTVMNWRHAFQTSLIALIDLLSPIHLFNEKYNRNFLLTNDIIFDMGKDSFVYLISEEYGKTCSIEEVQKYVTKYSKDLVL
ncbi:MAG: hypothetical protein AABZ74_06940 [Cyanobacteriota bacterium]